MNDISLLLLGFILGLLPSVTSKLYYLIYKKVKINKLIDLYYRHYIVQAYNLTRTNAKLDNRFSTAQAQNFCIDSIASLGFELDKEVHGANPLYSYELTKLVVFTQVKLKLIHKNLSFYTFKSPTSTIKEYKDDYNIKIQELDVLSNSFKKDAREYIYLKSLEYKKRTDI